MAEKLRLPSPGNRNSADGGRQQTYETLIPQIEALVAVEADPVANMANVAAALHEAFGFFWVGFYRVRGEDLVLGPFQGSLACTRIGYGRGVCGAAWQTGQSQLVPDVDQFPGHIACSSAARSEVVIPIFDSRTEVAGVLDIDSDRLADFSDEDIVFLEKLVQKISRKII